VQWCTPADDAGIYDFLRSQAQQGGSETAPSARLRETRTSQPKASTAVGRRIPRAAVCHVREAHQERTKEITRSAPRQPRMRYASLPRDEEQAAPQKAKVRPPVTTTRPKAQPLSRPIETGSDPVAALLRDPTLRPGDIVVFPDGPRAPRRSGLSTRAQRADIGNTDPKAALTGAHGAQLQPPPHRSHPVCGRNLERSTNPRASRRATPSPVRC
jgi:hypothetical protein